MSPTRSRARGFTLLELMVAAAIVGILASVAIPEFARFTLRAKTAERVYMTQRFKRAVEDYVVRNGKLPYAADPDSYVFTTYNPPWPPTQQKRPWDFSASGWDQLIAPGDVEGTLYYSYLLQAWEGSGSSYLYLYTVGDLDGDGVQAWKWLYYQKQDGVYQLTSEWPPPGQEDLNGF